jgi:ribonuclease HI
MLVTLFTDASFFDATKASAYALYGVSQRGTFKFSGRFQHQISDSTHAELAAIANALHIIMPNPLAAGAKRVLIQTDSKNAIKWLEERNCPRHPAVLAHILGLIDKWRVDAEFRHIKAHNGTKEPRFYCHDWCDKEARRIARMVHKEREGIGTLGKMLKAALPLPSDCKPKKVGKSVKNKS